jgi:SOS response regulatory protein OraA/RecX
MFGKSKRRFVTMLASGLLVIATIVAGAVALPQATSAAPAEGRGVPGAMVGQDDAFLAEALGITVEKLNEAQQAAHKAALAEAVEKGLITQAQADGLLSGDRFAGRGILMLRGGPGEIDRQALLAKALGITVEKLEAAVQTAAEARLAQAVSDGKLTQEQADLMKAGRALQNYIEEKGFFASAVEQAVKDGVITQDQADAILKNTGPGMRGFGKGGFDLRGGFDRFGGRGGFGGFLPKGRMSR